MFRKRKIDLKTLVSETMELFKEWYNEETKTASVRTIGKTWLLIKITSNTAFHSYLFEKGELKHSTGARNV